MATKPKRFIKGLRRQRQRVPESTVAKVAKVLPLHRDIPVTAAMPERLMLDTARPAFYDPRIVNKSSAADPTRRAQYDANGNLRTADGQLKSINTIAYITTTGSVRVLDYNASRRMLVIQNNGASFIRVNQGAAASLSLGLLIAAGAGYEYPLVSPQEVYIIGNAAGMNITILEGV